jgi:coenzyme F420 biosynthesis associated uncharacterized protein
VSAGPVDWQLARKVALKVAGDEPLARSYLRHSLEDDFAAFTPLAEELVADETGLVSTEGAARAVVIDRAGWIDANLRSFRRLLSPLLGKLDEASTMSSVSRRVGALELGGVLGWMSRRVLGQYDLLLTEDEERDSQDLVYYVGPNILSIEKRFAFPPADFRLWLALHELTHRAQFTGVPWLRPHFLSLVNALLDQVEPDPEQMKKGLRSFVEDRRAGRELIAEGGLAMLFATDAQRQLLDQVGGMMSLVEGHGDVTMTRAGVGHVQHAEQFQRVLHDRRTNVKGVGRLVQRLIGIEAKLAQYQAGEEFIAVIEEERGQRAVDLIWEDVSHLPTMAEIRDPASWLDRVPETSSIG